MSSTTARGIAAKSIDQNLSEGATLAPAPDVRGFLWQNGDPKLKAAQIDNHSINKYAGERLKQYEEVDAINAERKKTGDKTVKTEQYPDMEPKLAGQLGAIRKEVPSVKDVNERSLVGIIKDDFDSMKSQVQAREKGNLVRVTKADGSNEQGIITPSAEGPKREGLWIERNKSGNVISTAEFKNDKLDGIVRELDDQKRLRFLGNYKDGEPHGKHMTFDEKGECTKSKTYDHGNLKYENNPKEAKAEKAAHQAAQQASKGWSIG